MAQFKAGDNPADFKVAEVVEFLKGDDVTSDEYDRVIAAERERDGGGRLGILNMSGAEDTATDPTPGTTDNPSALEDPAGNEAAGPNEAATGQFSPADHAKTSSDPEASGDAGLTADKYGDDDPASLGPDKPQSYAEQEAHDATVAALPKEAQNALPVDSREGGYPARTYSPEEALREAVDRGRKAFRREDS